MNFLRGLFLKPGVHFDDQKESVAFVSVQILAILLLTVHLVFFAYFLMVQALWLVVGNSVSIVVYIISIEMCRKKHIYSASYVIVLEVALYCMLSTMLLGWDVGTHQFLSIMIFPCFMIFNLSRRRKALHCSTLLIAYLICMFFRDRASDIYSGVNVYPVFVITSLISVSAGFLVIAIMHLGHAAAEEEIAVLQDEASHDVLTGMFNRRYAEKILSQIFSNPSVQESSFITIFDIDFFKKVNDSFGHDVGDVVLKSIGSEIRSSFRQSDICARWGGEEFLVILTGTDEPGAFKAALNFIGSARNNKRLIDGREYPLTLTGGFCACRGCATYEECLKNCDVALYQGKNSGRNQVLNYKVSAGSKDLPMINTDYSNNL